MSSAGGIAATASALLDALPGWRIQWSSQYAPGPGSAGPPMAAPAQQSHTFRNVMLVIGLLLILFVGCFAAVGIFANRSRQRYRGVRSKGQGAWGPDNPLEIKEGEAFEVSGFDYQEGWSITSNASAGTFKAFASKTTGARRTARSSRSSSGRATKCFPPRTATDTRSIPARSTRSPAWSPTSCRRGTTASRSTTRSSALSWTTAKVNERPPRRRAGRAFVTGRQRLCRSSATRRRHLGTNSGMRNLS